MPTKHINTLLGGAGLLLALHLTAACVLCFLIGALLHAVLSHDGDN